MATSKAWQGLHVHYLQKLSLSRETVDKFNGMHKYMTTITSWSLGVTLDSLIEQWAHTQMLVSSNKCEIWLQITKTQGSCVLHTAGSKKSCHCSITACLYTSLPSFWSLQIWNICTIIHEPAQHNKLKRWETCALFTAFTRAWNLQIKTESLIQNRNKIFILSYNYGP